MGDSDVREHEAWSHRAGGPAIDLVASKLRRPLVPHGAVRRSSLIERLARGDQRPIVSVVAPPGYGKTTVLAQWAERNGQSFAWVSVDERDNDPKILLTYVAEALNSVEPIDERVFDALASPGSSVPGSVVPRLGSALASMTSPDESEELAEDGYRRTLQARAICRNQGRDHGRVEPWTD